MSSTRDALWRDKRLLENRGGLRQAGQADPLSTWPGISPVCCRRMRTRPFRSLGKPDYDAGRAQDGPSRSPGASFPRKRPCRSGRKRSWQGSARPCGIEKGTDLNPYRQGKERGTMRKAGFFAAVVFVAILAMWIRNAIPAQGPLRTEGTERGSPSPKSGVTRPGR